MPKKQKFPHLIGSRWTAQTPTFGWRHFQVITRKNEASLIFAEMMATCDPSVRFWVNAKMLRDYDTWLPGWQSIDSKSQILESNS